VLQQVQEIGICSISIGELLRDSRQEKGRKEQGGTAEILDAPAKVLGIDEHRRILCDDPGWIEEERQPIPTNDIWIICC
jgi:predicted nucleic acid-binding protein